MTELTHLLVKRFEQVSEDSFNKGIDWYDQANEYAASIKDKYSLEQSASVISHLSPRTRWNKNKEAAAQVIAGDIHSTGLFSSCVNRAILALGTNDPLSTFNGKKTTSFVHNILGNHDYVTLDSWMLSITHPELTIKERNNFLKRSGKYDLISDCFRYAAKYVDLKPAQLQSILWVDIRGDHA